MNRIIKKIVKYYTISKTQKMLKCTKVTDIIGSLEKNNYYSLEVCPGFDLQTLKYLERDPLFISVTWHAKKLEKALANDSVKLAERLMQLGNSVVLHFSCDELRVPYLREMLDHFIEIGLNNLLIIRGDRFDPSESDFPHTKDLVQFIKKERGNWFCVGVTGYPVTGIMEELQQKQESGADFIITQASNCPKHYINFKNDCKLNGINIPIIYGIFPYESEKSYEKFAAQCKIILSKHGYSNVKEMVSDLMKEANDTQIFHFFTMNHTKFVYQLWKELNFGN